MIQLRSAHTAVTPIIMHNVELTHNPLIGLPSSPIFSRTDLNNTADIHKTRLGHLPSGIFAVQNL